MIPMIASVWEVAEVKKIMAEVRKELEGQGIPYGEIELGIMIETRGCHDCGGSREGG